MIRENPSTNSPNKKPKTAEKKAFNTKYLKINVSLNIE